MKRLLIVLIGIAALAMGICIMVSENKMTKLCTEETTATVIGVVRDEDIDAEGYSSYTYYPQLEYTVGNRIVSKKGNGTSDESKYKTNDVIQIMYNPDNADEFIIKGDKSQSVAGIIWIILGVIILLVGIRKLLLGR